MTSAVSTQKLFACCAMEMYDHDPGGTSAVVCSPDGGTTQRWVDLRDFGGFAALAMSSTLTGAGITKLEIVASDSSTGATNVTVIKDSGTVAADAVGDYVVQECTADEIAQIGRAAGVDLRYVAARITEANAADEAVVTYIRHAPRFARLNLTANGIS